MELPFQPFTRRTFLSASALAGAAIAVPAAAMMPAATALASARHAVPAGWQGPALVLEGDYLARLGQLRQTLASYPRASLHLFLDDADTVLFDIASHTPAKGPRA